ncbi:MAG: iron complex outerrane recepter protein, partial [Bacteroidota bacterium]|nr:iron complex outerrane recepter protein [Bacteroidota bacterium]
PILIFFLKKTKMHPKTSFLFIYFLSLLASLSVSGQVKKDTVGLSELIIKSLPIQNSIQNLAAAAAVISEREITQTDGVILTSVLNKIPGVFMQQGSLNTNKITIRGIGSRSQYSTTRIKAYFEEIPLTSAEGETTIEDIDFEAISSIEIIKGPNATGFGAGLGGVINLFANKTPKEHSFAKASITSGSFELLKHSLSAGYSDKKSNIFANYSALQNKGYRANSNYDRKSINLFDKQQLSINSTLSFFALGTQQKAYIPSSINETDYNNSPQKAAATWEAANGYEFYNKALIGLGFEHHFSEKWLLNTSISTAFKNGYEARPFDILEDKNAVFNFRIKINLRTQLFAKPTTFSTGIESISENYDFSLYKNLYKSQPGQGSIQGDLFSAINQKRSNTNVFAQLNMQLATKLFLESGLAYNSTNYKQKDVFLENKTDQKSHSFGSIWLPRLGFSYKMGSQKNIYASISKGFSTPTVAETLTPEGEINTDLKPEIGINYEMGFKGSFLKSKLYTELIFYNLIVENLLVARRLADDQYMGMNAGKSSHQGMEFLLNYKWIFDSNLQFLPYCSGTINHFLFTDFIDKGNDFSGNKLPAVPGIQYNIGFDLNTHFGLNFNANYGYYGTMAMDDANAKFTSNYQLLDAKLGYSFTLFKNLKAEINTGIQNALNQPYTSSILPNAVGIGTAQPRYYYPGNPRNFYFGGRFFFEFLSF